MKTMESIKSIKNYRLKDKTTLKIGGEARIAYFPNCVEEIYEINDAVCREKIAVIGEGSNLLISSQGVEEKVIFTNNLKNLTILDDTRVKAECGLKSSTLARILLENSLSGLEFLIGIPGSIGGAVVMNSSAHAQSIEDSIESAEVIDLRTCEIKTLSKEELKLGYRSSFVEKNTHLIISAVFNLKKDLQETIAEKMDFHVNYRKERHPCYITQPNAGSTFRNPSVGIYAGRLFEQLGAKEWAFGGARLSDRHANFIVNTGNATSLDVSRLMHKMHSEVKNHFGYDFTAEIRYLGIPTKEEEEIWKTFTVH